MAIEDLTDFLDVHYCNLQNRSDNTWLRLNRAIVNVI